MAVDPLWADPAPAAATAKAGKPAPAAADAKPEATDDSCKSLVTSTNDYWCATQCANDKGSVACPPTICKCDSHA